MFCCRTGTGFIRHKIVLFVPLLIDQQVRVLPDSDFETGYQMPGYQVFKKSDLDIGGFSYIRQDIQTPGT